MRESVEITSQILKGAGISTDSVNLILITHDHYDHVTGIIKNGKAVFPNAKVLFSEKEKPLYEYIAIDKIPADYKQHFLPANEVLKVYGYTIDTFTFENPVTEGISSVDLSGHAAGHCGRLVQSNGRKILIAGDIFHIAQIQFPHPEYSLVFDSDINTAANVSTNFIETSAKNNTFFAGTRNNRFSQ
jgi:glyoxylase-like metal-dependent hydrolase (beta-lactamase superfamily II)